MRSIKSIVLAVVLGVSMLAPVGTAEAAPISAPVVAAERHSDVTNVYWREVCRYDRCRRVWVEPRPRVIIQPQIIIRPQSTVRRGGWDAHVRWCSANRRAYRVSNNSYIGRDGFRHRCMSPYYSW